MLISVVIPTHDPDPGYLRQVLAGLQAQSLPLPEWELVLVDNASNPPLAKRVDLTWHPRARVVREERLGLTAARLAGFAAAQGELIVLVDDDNVLVPDFLSAARKIAEAHPHLGAFSGQVELVFEPGVEPPPPAWYAYLTGRTCRQAVWSNDPSHLDSTPWGAGLCLRRQVATGYAQRSQANPDLLRLDLHGQNLVYGGDTDIAYFGCSIGLGKGVFPELRVRHLIAPRRCERAHLLRVIEGRAYSEWLHHWVLHRVVPREAAGPVARLKWWLRLLTADRDSRSEAWARRRGHARAAQDLAPLR